MNWWQRLRKWSCKKLGHNWQEQYLINQTVKVRSCTVCGKYQDGKIEPWQKKRVAKMGGQDVR